ncbi:hypothetical protein GCM10011492_26780 [Flexivirga endophytica]|uniref:ABC-2 type transporter transmembrane domain-containing protein n=1 Tax=Flexivirga endophytica TaxID=1849103 RepID=A0A916T8J4_9MICO|nr:ABC transporter permease [Flexivirga endophytica]GGB34759.1 hypothetical protein GCM10011492_26780 [Flexivirga endophytica]GHB42665.1 hypothetical protein GCM10008112_09160 [Flexivirga endophytica]
MSARILGATIRRILQQLRADPRTVAMIIAVPALLLTLLYFIYGGGPVFNRIALTMLGILPMLVIFLITSVAMLRERTSGTLERLLTTPLHRADLLAAYGIAFSLAATAQSVVLVCVSVWALGVTTAGPIVWVLLVAAVSAAVGVATGLLASAFARTEFQAVQFMPLVIGPQIYLCGLLVPHSSMPRSAGPRRHTAHDVCRPCAHRHRRPAVTDGGRAAKRRNTRGVRVGGPHPRRCFDAAPNPMTAEILGDSRLQRAWTKDLHPVRSACRLSWVRMSHCRDLRPSSRLGARGNLST